MMGVISVTSETVFDYKASVLCDHASNPNDWGKNYKGSGGMQEEEEINRKLPLKFGHIFTENVTLGENTYQSKWTMITVHRPCKFVVQQVNDIDKLADGSGGVDGITTITYTFEPVSENQTVSRRNLTCEVPRGVDPPDDLLTVTARPGGIDRYHDNIRKELDQQHERS